MKIFISWSGELSHSVAKDLKDWLSCVLQEVDSFVSSEDIRKGQRWAFEVAKELDESNFGIICLTKDNLNAPWILFEAGALSKSVKEANVSALLINGIKMADITGPLSQFQHTTTSKEDFQKLLATINEKAGQEKLEDVTLRKVFEKWWPDLEAKIRLNIESANGETSHFEERTEREILVETLELARFLAQRSVNPSDFKNVFETIDSVLRIDDGVLISPKGGEFNHPTEIRVFPVPIHDGEQEKLVSVTISNTGIETTEIHPPFQTRGVTIIMTFLSETENQCWETEFQFHKGNTLVETRMLDKEDHGEEKNEEFYGPGVIWRD
ncbi:MAG: toll/interleukin-1 receptor domain-containing protein [Anaerolineales bacterium]|nr:toll/interleukin-1 receptor domain-containing protein [Anaerolineales bacterium]